MASCEPNEESLKSATTDKMDLIEVETKTDAKEPSITLTTEKNNSSNNAINIEEKRSSIDTAPNESENMVKKINDSIQNEGKHLKILTTDKNKQDNNDNKVNKNEEVQVKVLSPKSESPDEGKDANIEDSKGSSIGGSSLKRKRKSLNSSITPINSSVEESTRSKRKKLKNMSDRFCWRCHKESVDAHCTACPRSWHRKCIGGMPPSFQKWICGECATILKAENAETRSTAMAQLSIDQLCMLLKHVIERLRDYPGSEPFWKPVDLSEVPNYLDYVVKPMDLSLLESNVRSKLYGSTDAFMADAKWIQHNCIVFNTCGGVYADTSKLTNAAKQVIKVARQEVSEIEACPDCYAHGRNLPRPQPSWFIEACRQPHPLVWAKLKGFPFWPAKAMPRVNSQGHVDVRFFGEHDRAWVSPKDLYLYSEEPPAPSPRKRKTDMDECVREITRHCRKLELAFGQFQFAPPKVQYNPNDPMQIKLMLPNYDPLEPNRLNSEFLTPKRKGPVKKRTMSLKSKSQNDESAVDNRTLNTNMKEDASADNHKKETETMTPNKIQKLDLNDIKCTLDIQENSNSNNIKIDKKTDETISLPVAPNKIARDGSRTMKIPLIKNVTRNNNATSSNTNISDKTNLQKVKDEVKPIPENLSSSVTSPTRETSDMVRVQKKTALKNAAPKREVSQNSEGGPKAITKLAKSTKVYKPKARMVDKLNAEKALKSISESKENDKVSPSNSGGITSKTSLSGNSTKELVDSQKIPEVNLTLLPATASNLKIHSKAEPHTISSTNLHTPAIHSADKSVLLLVVNNGKAEAVKQSTTLVDYHGNKDILTTAHREAKEVHRNPLQKKESKARKTFPNKIRNYVQTAQRSVPDAEESVVHVSSTKQETSCAYQLLPPEAGPISARLHHSAQELARRMGQLMEEAYKEAAQTNSNHENGTSDNYQATIYFLRMQIEHMKWQHQQQLAELKHNTDRTLREMRASLEAEKLRLIEEVRREAEEEKVRCVEETKRKQWCAKCGQEALFYCCWNTAYCDYPCQQSHWPSHMRTCSQQPAFTTMVTSSGANSNPQQNNNTTVHSPAGRAYPLSQNKLSGVPSWSAPCFKNKTDQDSL